MVLIDSPVFFYSMIVFGDLIVGLFVYTVVWKRQVGTWWWSKPPAQTPYGFKIDSNGWSFHAKEFNPLETFRKMMDDFTGKNKPMSELVQDTVRNTVKMQVKQAVVDALSQKEVNETLSDIIKETVMSELSTLMPESDSGKKKSK